MLTKKSRNRIRNFLVSKQLVKIHLIHETKEECWLFFGMQRSGNHAILNWLCYGLSETVHLNNCTIYGNFKLRFMPSGIKIFGAGEPFESALRIKFNPNDKELREQINETKNRIYSFENTLPEPYFYAHFLARQTIVILRDPANWLASFKKHYENHPNLTQKLINGMMMYKKHLRFALQHIDNPTPFTHIINYNEFIQNQSYRALTSKKLGIHNLQNAESTLATIPENGGGSSFTKLQANPEVDTRWQTYRTDTAYLNLLNDKELIHLSTQFFKKIPGFNEMGLLKSIS
jgi:hypothetical protein